MIEFVENLIGTDHKDVILNSSRSSILNEASDTHTSNSKPLVLIVEDEDLVATSLAEVLEAHEYSAIICDDCAKAIRFISDRIPELIICDVNLPNKSGTELFIESRKNTVWSDIPFVFISGMSSTETEREALRLGVDSFIKKPLDTAELLDVIQGKLSQKVLRSKANEYVLEGFRKNVTHTLSHEFRTPLVSITTGAELLIEEYAALEDEQVKTLLLSILRGGQRLERLVDDFMMMQQIDLGGEKQRFDALKTLLSFPVVYEKLKQQLDSFLKQQYDSATFHLNMSSDLENVIVEIMPDQFIDTIIRLADNACKFSPDAKIVWITVDKKEDNIEFSIRDKGMGFPKSLRRDGLKRFTQIGREYLEQQGCGIGLSIASHFVSVHGGTLEFGEPEDGKGTVVRVRLPIYSEV